MSVTNNNNLVSTRSNQQNDNKYVLTSNYFVKQAKLKHKEDNNNIQAQNKNTSTKLSKMPTTSTNKKSLKLEKNISDNKIKLDYNCFKKKNKQIFSSKNSKINNVGDEIVIDTGKNIKFSDLEKKIICGISRKRDEKHRFKSDTLRLFNKKQSETNSIIN